MKQIDINAMIIMALFYWLMMGLSSCYRQPVTGYERVDKPANIYPAYQGTVIPPNIAPFNFEIREVGERFKIRISVPARDSFEITTKKIVKIPVAKWKNLLNNNRGSPLEIHVFAKRQEGWIKYDEILFHIAEEPVDPFIAYRLIEPGYVIWNRMGIYQRNIENFDESPIMINTLTDNNCINCHSFCRNDPETMLFHLRKHHAGTIIVMNGNVKKLDLKTPDMPSAAVYPRWHPDGRYIAFSSNVTQQGFHAANTNKVEVFDKESDIFIYDPQTNTIFTDSMICSPHRFETFPEWSPDGKYLYYHSATARLMPREYDLVKYDLLRIPFDPQTATFGLAADTLVSAENTGKSATFARLAPDGKNVVFCLSDYGTFPVWHNETDLYRLDLETMQMHNLEIINSNRTESYHSWSSNGRWLVFASRRLDGRFTRLFISYFDHDNSMHAPFLVPQENPSYYDDLLLSYNIPEFITGKVKIPPRKFRRVARN